MKVEEVLVHSPKHLHIGYQPDGIWEHPKAPFCWDLATKLRKIPGKVTSFFQKDKIVEVRKSTVNNPAGTYYLLLTDGSYLEIEY